jgi:alpha-D-ribose 1-methylphosphonate 5-triphosphate diphosphatase
MDVILTNTAMVLPDGVVRGSIWLKAGCSTGSRHAAGVIADIQPGGTSIAGALDMDGEMLIPGAVDLHTDNLERQVEPRGGTRWPSRSAFLAHDAQCAAAGITTVLNALCVGDLGFDEQRGRTCAEGIADLDALAPTGLLRADHYLHLRCELPAPGMVEQVLPLLGHRLLRLISLMDHTPGGGQYADLVRYRAMRLRDGDDPGAIEASVAALQAQREHTRAPNRAALLALARALAPAVALASHDDRTVADVAENAADGLPIAEFPVSSEAAEAAREAGQAVIAGAPNLVRGGSHTGNVAVADLLDAGLVDALASDYVPASLIEAAFIAAARPGWDLQRAIALISAAPAAMAGLSDRGRLAVGLRADVVRVRVHEGAPVVRQVWRAGERVM